MRNLWLRLWPLGYLFIGTDLHTRRQEIQWGLFANPFASPYVDPCLLKGRKVLADL